MANSEASGTPSDFPVMVTPQAVRRLKSIQQRENKQDCFLRLGVRGGGCSGFEYVLKLDRRELASDIVTEIDGLRVAVDAKSAEYLRGATLDFTGELIGGGFKFENPNAERGCGCGTSFAPKGWK